MKLYLAIFAGKVYMFISKIFGNSRSDRVGLLCAKICPDILKKISKPKTVILVTGTNGKTTVTNLIYNILKSDNKKIGFNDWGANMVAGHIRCLLTCVNLFNKSNKDYAILECDELISSESISLIKPNYVIVTNICRDSIRRNAYPEYIFNRINTGINNSLDSFLILNADDPISSFLGSDNKKVFVSIDKYSNNKVYENISNDYPVCFNCNGKVSYDYKHYRHIGKWSCSNCGLSSFKGDYVVSKINFTKKNMVLNNENYPIISNSLFNIYNELSVIVLLKKLGYDEKFIKNALNSVSIPKTREDLEVVNDIKIFSRMAKGQNASAASTVFENLVKDKSKKQLVLLLDEVYGDLEAHETITWLYDTDFELLNNELVEKIIVITNKPDDYRLRLLLSGVDDDKIYCTEDYVEACDFVNLDKNCDIYVLYELDERPNSRIFIKKLKERILKEVK